MQHAVVGRRTELETLERFAADVAGGEVGLFLEGPAGIGKTRLWQEGVELARRRGLRVLATRPGGADVQLSFAGLADLLEGVLDETLPMLPPPQRRALEVALLLEESSGVPPDQRAVSAAFLASLRLLASSTPLVIAVDDAQWLDPPSARVLEFALRRVREGPVGVLATVRVDPVEPDPDDLARAVGDRLTRAPLGPMSVGALYELIRLRLEMTLSRSTLLRVHETSGGNPFFALELARALRETGAEPGPGDPLPVPAGLRDLLRGRLAGLPAPARETLLFAAALAQPTVPVLEAAVGDPERVGADLERAIDAGVVGLEGESIRFVHPLLASTHYAAAAPHRRRGVHARLAEVAASAEERARHLAHACDRPDDSVAAALEQAAEEARRRGAVSAAAELAVDAMRLSPETSPADAHRRRLVAAEYRYAAGDTANAVTILESALETTPPGARRAELLTALGDIRFEGRDTRVGHALYRAALQEDHDDERLRARVLERLASGVPEGLAQKERYARNAAELAEAVGDAATLACALAHWASAKTYLGHPFPTHLFERAAALEESLGIIELDYGPTALYASALANAGELDRARLLLERLCELGRASGDAAVHQPLTVLASLEWDAGNWARSAVLAREAYEVAVQSGREAAEPKGMFSLARVEASVGDIESARARAEAALVLTQGRGWKSGGPRSVLSLVELSLENYEAAYDSVKPAMERYQQLGFTVSGHECLAVEALAGCGRTADGRALLGPAEDAAKAAGVRWLVAAAARARGLLEAADGDLESAERVLEEAVALAEPLGMPLELGRSLLALGTVRRRRQRKQAAREALMRALEVFEELGARIWAERARAELGRIGGRAASATELSAAEHQVVELVRAGRTNREIAEALHLSQKTVEWNLSKVYRKLGVRSRAELAAARATREA